MTEVVGEEDVTLVNINGRQFRKRMTNSKTAVSLIHFLPKIRNSDEDFEYEEEEDGEFMEKDDSGMYIVRLELASVYYKYVLGKKGETKQRIEKDTKTILTIPKTTDQYLTISGHTKNSVLNARTRIDIICENANNSLPYTHFLCIPLNYEAIINNVTKFDNDIINEAQKMPIEGFDPSILQSPKQLHLTILMLKLYTEKQVEKVKNILKDITPQIYDLLETRSVVVQLKGLEIMNDDDSQVDVLYGQVLELDHSNRLSKMTKFLVDEFRGQGLLTEEQDRNVKLHATLINTRNRRQDETKEKPKRETFNAHGIMSKYGSYDFGTTKLTELHLSQRGSYDKNGFFQCLAKVVFP